MKIHQVKIRSLITNPCIIPLSILYPHGRQRFRLRVQSSARVYAYALVYNVDKTFDLLMPESGEQTPLVEPGVAVHLPTSGNFRFAPPAGTDEFWLVVSPEPLPFLAPKEIWEYAQKIAGGGKLDEKEEAALGNLSTYPSIIPQ